MSARMHNPRSSIRKLLYTILRRVFHRRGVTAFIFLSLINETASNDGRLRIVSGLFSYFRNDEALFLVTVLRVISRRFAIVSYRELRP